MFDWFRRSTPVMKLEKWKAREEGPVFCEFGSCPHRNTSPHDHEYVYFRFNDVESISQMNGEVYIGVPDQFDGGVPGGGFFKLKDIRKIVWGSRGFIETQFTAKMTQLILRLEGNLSDISVSGSDLFRSKLHDLMLNIGKD